MPNKVILISIGLFIIVLVIGVISVLSSVKNMTIARKRLKDLQSYGDEEYSFDVHQALSFVDRIFNPLFIRFEKLLSSFSSVELRDKYQKMITQANAKKKTALQVIGFKGLWAVMLPLTVYMVFFKGKNPLTAIIIGIPLAIFGFYLPDIELKSQIKKRHNKMLTQIPYIFDLLCVCVDAGLGFDSALAEVTRGLNNDLSNEFSTLLKEISVNIPLAQALDNLYERIGLDEIKQFAIAVKSTEELGAEIGTVLKTQSEMVHDSSRQRAQEIAQKLPVKMLFPLIFFIFPTMFAVLLSPAVVMLINAFKQGGLF